MRLPHVAITLFSPMGALLFTFNVTKPLPVRATTMVVALQMLLMSPQLLAFDPDVRSSPSNVLDFSLLIEHSAVELERDGETVDANVERIGMLSIDVPDDGLRFGLALGYAFSDFDNNDLYRSISMDGYYLGVSVQGVLVDSSKWSVTARAEYIFQDVDGSDVDNNTASFSWHEYVAAISVNYALSGTLRVAVESIFTDINATYRERGVSSQTVKLGNSRRGGVQGELQYWLNDREAISVQYRNAALQGVVLRFRRLF